MSDVPNHFEVHVFKHERDWLPYLERFNRLIQFYVLLQATFFLVILVEILSLYLFFAFLNPAVLTFLVALLFMTVFGYCMFKLYLQAQRPDQYMEISKQFLDAYKQSEHYQEGVLSHHIALAQAAHQFASALYEKEYHYYPAMRLLNFMQPLLEKLSCLCYWKDLHRMKEILLNAAVEEYLKIVKYEPMSLKAHALLANAYVSLSSIYADPRKYKDYDEELYIPKERFSLQMEEKFKAVATRAIEEFKILNDYAPQDPWVHNQLAYSYHDLQMPQEEIREYETLLQLSPEEDMETLFKLGMLYFQQGLNARGLQAYSRLKQKNQKQAENLIKFYGTYDPM